MTTCQYIFCPESNKGVLADPGNNRSSFINCEKNTGMIVNRGPRGVVECLTAERANPQGRVSKKYKDCGGQNASSDRVSRDG